MAPWIVALLIVFAASACSGDQRPTNEEWEPVWLEAVGGFPTMDELGDPPDPDECNDALVSLREVAPGLTPTPDVSLDDPVRNWVNLAEEIVFECPPDGTGVASLEEGYRELARLEAEVAAVLGMDTGS